MKDEKLYGWMTLDDIRKDKKLYGGLTLEEIRQKISELYNKAMFVDEYYELECAEHSIIELREYRDKAYELAGLVDGGLEMFKESLDYLDGKVAFVQKFVH